MSELEQIIHEIESEDIDVDRISEKVKRAATLIALCKSRLRATEEEVKDLLAEVEGRGERGDEEPETGGPEDLDAEP